jgi:hypothetical protein
LRTQNQRAQLASSQIVVVDRRTPIARRKEWHVAPVDLSTKSATHCKQGLSQLAAANGNRGQRMVGSAKLGDQQR